MLWSVWCKRSWPVHVFHSAIPHAPLLPKEPTPKKGLKGFITTKPPFWQPLMLFLCRSTQIKTYSWDNAQVVLAGNKCDMEEERVVSVDSGRLLAEQLGKSWGHNLCCRRALSHSEQQTYLAQEPHWHICRVDYRSSPSFTAALLRFWILWDQRQRQHQREADVRTPRRPNLRQDVREPGQRSGRDHGTAHHQAHGQRSATRAVGVQLLVTADGKGRCRSCTAVQCTEFCSLSIITPAPAAFSGLQL